MTLQKVFFSHTPQPLFYNCIFFQWKMLWTTITLKNSFQFQYKVCNRRQGIVKRLEIIFVILLMLCKSSRHKDAEIHLNVYAASMVFDHNKFLTCRCVTAVTSVYVDGKSKFSFERHSNFRTHFKFYLPYLNLLMWLQLLKRSLTPGAILMTYSSYS